MKTRYLYIIVLSLAIFSVSGHLLAQPHFTPEIAEQQEFAASDKLVVLWTSGDREVALKMVFMYT